MASKRPKIGHKGLKYSFIKILTGSDLSSRRLAVMEMKGKEAGPILWLTGCVHGDEVGGIVIIQEVFKRLTKEGLLTGRVLAFPLMNPIGFENSSRNLSPSKEDLNRSFPGQADGTMAERLANTIFSYIKNTKPNLVLDLHNDWLASVPYTLIDPNPGTKHKDAYDQSKTFARVAGFPIVDEEEENLAEKTELIKTLSGSLLQADIPALTLEIGGAYVVNEKNVADGVTAIFNILEHLGMIAKSIDEKKPAENKIRYYSHQPECSESGLIRFTVEPGQLVKKGDTLARIYNIFGKLVETLSAKNDALVLGHADSAVALPGLPVIALGVDK